MTAGWVFIVCCAQNPPSSVAAAAVTASVPSQNQTMIMMRASATADWGCLTTGKEEEALRLTLRAREKGGQLLHLVERLRLEVLGLGGSPVPVPAVLPFTGCRIFGTWSGYR